MQPRVADPPEENCRFKGNTLSRVRLQIRDRPVLHRMLYPSWHIVPQAESDSQLLAFHAHLRHVQPGQGGRDPDRDSLPCEVYIKSRRLPPVEVLVGLSTADSHERFR